METSIAWWDWLGIGLGIVGVVAFLMAVQPFLQMWFGKPDVDFVFGDLDVNGLRFLRCDITSNPVGNRWLRKLGVHRDSAYIRASVMVREANTSRLIRIDLQPLIHTPESNAEQVQLPFEGTTAWFTIACMQKGSFEATLICDNRMEGEVRLPIEPGE